MQVQLDRATFKRLIWLYVATGLASLASVIPELFSPRWIGFGYRFDELVELEFGATSVPDNILFALFSAFIVSVVWMIVSTIGLFFFKPWARFGMWASVLAAFLLYGLFQGNRPIYTSPAFEALAMADSVMFGAILLLAYAKGYGADWFAQSAPRTED